MIATTNFYNVFSTLMFCGYCGAPHKPHLELARAGQLIPPELRRAAAKKSVVPALDTQPSVKNVA